MLGSYPGENYEVQEEKHEIEINSWSSRQDPELFHDDEEFRSNIDTNLSENSGLTVETSSAVNSKISSHVSRQLEELKSGINAQVLEVLNSAIAEKVLPSFGNSMRSTKTNLNAKRDLRSDRLHHSEFAQTFQRRDLW